MQRWAETRGVMIIGKVEDLNVLKRLQEAPRSGWMLAYTREKVIFKAYEETGKDWYSEISGKELLELHLFDKDKEYRCVMTTSRRYPNGVIEAVISDRENGADMFEEEILVQKKEKDWPDRITMRHYICEEKELKSGMIYIGNYRLLVKDKEDV